MRRLFTFIKNFLWAFASLFWKRDKKVVLFGSWMGLKFADNSRFLFQYLSANRQSLGLKHVIWVTRKEDICASLQTMGYEAFLIGTKESNYWHKHAGIHIVCNSNNGDNADIDVKYSYGATKINLWHGIGNKRTGRISGSFLESKQKHPRRTNLRIWLEDNLPFYRVFLDAGGWKNCFWLVTGKYISKVFADEMGLNEKRMVYSDYPRHDLANVVLTPQEVIVLDEIKKRNKTILYLPTFRIGGETPNYEEVGAGIQNELKRDDVLLIQKRHSADKTCGEQIARTPNVLDLSPDFDINVLLPYIDVLITDYSSAMNDATYFGKPIVFYVPDYEDYKQGKNGFIVDPDYFLCGPKVRTVGDLVIQLDKALKCPDAIKPKNYDEINGMAWEKRCDCEQIWKDITSMAGLH